MNVGKFRTQLAAAAVHRCKEAVNTSTKEEGHGKAEITIVQPMEDGSKKQRREII